MTAVAAAPRARKGKALEPTTRVEALLSMKWKYIRQFVNSQDIAYWAILFYLFIEYVRPQQIISPLAVIPFGEISIGMAALTFLGTGHWFKVKSVANPLLLAYCAIVLASSFTAYDVPTAQLRWSLFFDWVVIYFLIINIVHTEERFVLFMLTYLIYNYYMSQGAAKQWVFRGFSFASWGVKGAPGWFENSGEFGIEMCIFLPISWHYYQSAKPYLTKWRRLFVLGMPVTALMGTISCSSRGALLGVGSVGLWAIMRSKQRVKAIIGLAVLATIMYFSIPDEQMERFRQSGEDSTSTRRMTYWTHGLEMTQDHPLLGIGYGNWIKYYTDYYVDRSEKVDAAIGFVQLPHNIFIQCMAELGYTGLVGFLALIVATFVINYKTRKNARAGPQPSDFVLQMGYAFDGALIAFLSSGFFITVLYYPFFWINLAFTVALNHISREHVKRQRRLAASGVTAAAPVAVAAQPMRGRKRLPPRR